MAANPSPAQAKTRAAQQRLSSQPLRLLPASAPGRLAERARADAAVRDDLRRECAVAIASATPAEPAQIGILLHRLSLHYADRKLTAREAQLVAEDWLNDLDGLPLDLAELAFRRWRTGPKCAFFPKAGEILGLVEVERRTRAILHRRAQAVIEAMTGDPA